MRPAVTRNVQSRSNLQLSKICLTSPTQAHLSGKGKYSGLYYFPLSSLDWLPLVYMRPSLHSQHDDQIGGEAKLERDSEVHGYCCYC